MTADEIVHDDLGLHRLGGPDAPWIWALACPIPTCRCRTLLLLSTPGERVEVLRRCQPVRDAWLSSNDVSDAAAQARAIAFKIDFETALVFAPTGSTPLDLARRPDIGALVDRVDGRFLETLGCVWLLARGELGDRDRRALEDALREIAAAERGAAANWLEAQGGTRRDLYVIGDRSFRAVDMFRVVDAPEVFVEFATVTPRGAPKLGGARVDAAGKAQLEPSHERHRARLEELWRAYVRRHPGFAERLARKVARMRREAREVAAREAETSQIPVRPNPHGAKPRRA